jgi:hypothetical protein
MLQERTLLQGNRWRHLYPVSQLLRASCFAKQQWEIDFLLQIQLGFDKMSRYDIICLTPGPARALHRATITRPGGGARGRQNLVPN